MTAGVRAHEVTTAHLGSAYPFMANPSLGATGIYVGRDLLGGIFTYDPFDLYSRGIVTNANMIVIGQIGRGKSSFVKSFLWRQAVFGRRSWVVDPKGEYGSLAAAWGVEPVRIRPGGTVRLNPLEVPGGVVDPGEAERRRLELVSALGAASLGRPLSPAEHAAAEMAVKASTADAQRRGDVPTLPDVVRLLLAPSEDAASALSTDLASLITMGRDLALELRRLVEGDLRGMFDGPTSAGVDLAGALVVLDLSSVYHSPALGVLMTCAMAWLSAILQQAGRSIPGAFQQAGRAISELGQDGRERTPAGDVFATGAGMQRLVVVDEAWAILSNLAVARWLQASWKLSRAFGVANIAILHRLSDLSAAGGAASEQVALARGLLSDSETRVVYAQPPGEIEACRDLLDVTATEADLLPRLPRGTALWKVGDRSFLVEHRLGSAERRIIDTDGAMR